MICIIRKRKALTLLSAYGKDLDWLQTTSQTVKGDYNGQNELYED